MKCILLCAGYATRLYPLTENYPKALIEIEKGKPILDYILSEVNTISEIDKIYVVSNEKYYKNFVDWKNNVKSDKEIEIINDHTTSNEDRLGAIGDIQYVIKEKNINDELLVIAGDNLFDYKLRDVIDFYNERKSATICTKRIDDVSLLKRLAVATMDNDYKIIDLTEKPEVPKSNIGVYTTYVYPKEIINHLDTYLADGNNPDAPGYLVEWLYKRQPVYSYCIDGNCFDVGTFETLDEVRNLYNSNISEYDKINKRYL